MRALRVCVIWVLAVGCSSGGAPRGGGGGTGGDDETGGDNGSPGTGGKGTGGSKGPAPDAAAATGGASGGSGGDATGGTAGAGTGGAEGTVDAGAPDSGSAPAGDGGAAATSFPIPPGMTQIFDGKTLNGWTGSTSIWSVDPVEMAIHGKTGNGGQLLKSAGDYDDFRVVVTEKAVATTNHMGLCFWGTRLATATVAVWTR